MAKLVLNVNPSPERTFPIFLSEEFGVSQWILVSGRSPAGSGSETRTLTRFFGYVQGGYRGVNAYGHSLKTHRPT